MWLCEYEYHQNKLNKHIFFLNVLNIQQLISLKAYLIKPFIKNYMFNIHFHNW